MMTYRSFAPFVAALVALTLTGSHVLAGASSEGVLDVQKGTVKLNVTPVALMAFNSQEIFFSKISPTTIIFSKAQIVSPIRSGVIVSSTAELELIASGGFRISNQNTTVTIIDPVVNFSRGNGTVSALITTNGSFQGRVNLGNFTAAISTPVNVPGNNKITVKDLSLRLSVEAAAALNLAFSTTVFQPGQELATVDLSVKVSNKRL